MFVQLINNKPSAKGGNNNIVFFNKATATELAELSASELGYVQQKAETKTTIIPIYSGKNVNWAIQLNAEKSELDDFRVLGANLAVQVQTEKAKNIHIDASLIQPEQLLALCEGFVLENYQFLKYFKDEDKVEKTNSIELVDVYHSKLNATEVDKLNNTLKAVYWARDMINEPVNYMNSVRFAEEVQEKGKESGMSVEVFDKKKIEALRMGGLLAVNKGSIDPPTFTICEWKPTNAVNKKPYVLVGKGIMYDTGGLSLKPTPNSMDLMKSDMGGAAAVAGTLYSIALNKEPIWVVALLPATDNRPDGNAYTPGDIIKMYNGLFVEVLNTDAEGRIILADGLSYGDKYDPELIMTVATLTGSASLAVGTHATVFMGNADDKWFTKLSESGSKTHERLVQFPFWKEYGECLKSNVADLKNLGNREGGAISAGKFLENFTKAPYIHFDIAGPAFLTAAEKYKPKGGTGVGVRLLNDFFKSLANSKS